MKPRPTCRKGDTLVAPFRESLTESSSLPCPLRSASQMAGKLALVALLAGLVTGCVNLAPQTDATRFYVLEAATSDATAADAGCSRTILIGPVRLAGHLEQPAVVERLGDHEVRYLEWHRWAEPLTQAVPRTLVRRLAGELPGACVAGYQRVTLGADTLQVEIEIDRLELTSGNQAVVAASWRILKPGGSGVTQRNEATFTASFDPGTNRVAAGIAALSTQMDQLVKALAAESETR